MPNYRLLRQGAPNLFTNVVGESADVVGESADVPSGSGRMVGAHNITLHNITGETPNPLKGVFPKNLISDKFKKA